MGKIADTTRPWNLAQEQRRQLLVFDKEFDAAHAKVRDLEAQVLNLEKEIHPLQKKVERLEQRVQEETAKTAMAEKLRAHKVQEKPPETLTENGVKVLQFLALCKLKDSRPPVTAEIAKALKINEIRANVLVREMQERSYIWFSHRIGVGGGWHLNDAGEEYLVTHNLL